MSCACQLLSGLWFGKELLAKTLSSAPETRDPKPETLTYVRVLEHFLFQSAHGFAQEDAIDFGVAEAFELFG